MTALAPRPRTAASTDDALVDAAIDGDERAWTTICEQHLPQVRAVAHARLRDAHAAEDVVQETFLRAWTRLPQVRDASRLGPWLKTIAANAAIDHVRGQRSTAPLEAARATPAPGPSHDEVVVAREEAAVLHRHLAELREVDRRALWQRDGHGVSIGELADELGMTSGSVRVMLSRARQRVRDGYGVLAAPLVGLLDRWRNRMAGLGDAVPVAVAAPALVVAVVAGVGLPALDMPAPGPGSPTGTIAPATPVAVTPAAATEDARQPTTAEPSRRPSAAPAAVTPSSAPSPTSDAAAPRVDLGSESAGFSDGAPTEDDTDAEAPAPGPVESLEVDLEGSGFGELGKECQLLCDD